VTIGRLDTLLQDLRKFGFSLVTGLLTASGIVSGIAGNRDVLPPAAVVVMVLVLAWFEVDTFYQVVLSGAVERAMDLEHASAGQVQLTTERCRARRAGRDGGRGCCRRCRHRSPRLARYAKY